MSEEFSFNPKFSSLKKHGDWDFPSGPLVKTSPSSIEGMGSVPGLGAKILCTSSSWTKSQNIKQKQYCGALQMSQW